MQKPFLSLLVFTLGLVHGTTFGGADWATMCRQKGGEPKHGCQCPNKREINPYKDTCRRDRTLSEFEEACRGDNYGTTLINHKPKPNNLPEFLKIAEQSENTNEFFSKLKKSPTFHKHFKRHVLMHATRSLHRGAVDRAHPRVILFNDDLIIAAAHHSSPRKAIQAKTNRVEAIHYNWIKHDYEFVLLDFNTSPVEIDRSGNKCQSCHGDTLRPIWNTYRNWPGSYPSLGSFVWQENPAINRLNARQLKVLRFRQIALQQVLTYVEQKTSKQLREHVESLAMDPHPWSRHGEFKNGFPPKDTPPTGDAKLDALLFDPVVYEKNEAIAQITRVNSVLDPIKRKLNGIHALLEPTGASQPGAMLNEFLNLNNFDRILTQIKSVPDYNRLKYAIMASLLRCSDIHSFLGKAGSKGRRKHDAHWGAMTDKELHDRILRKTRTDFDQRIQYAIRIGDGQAQSDDFNDRMDVARLAGLQYLLEPYGVDVKTFSANRAPRDYGYGFSQFGAGDGGLRRLYCSFIPELVRENKQLRKMVNIWAYATTAKYEALFCPLLRAESLKVFTR